MITQQSVYSKFTNQYSQSLYSKVYISELKTRFADNTLILFKENIWSKFAYNLLVLCIYLHICTMKINISTDRLTRYPHSLWCCLQILLARTQKISHADPSENCHRAIASSPSAQRKIHKLLPFFQCAFSHFARCPAPHRTKERGAQIIDSDEAVRIN